MVIVMFRPSLLIPISEFKVLLYLLYMVGYYFGLLSKSKRFVKHETESDNSKAKEGMEIKNVDVDEDGDGDQTAGWGSKDLLLEGGWEWGSNGPLALGG
ncbi:hypothetical protein K443DRAFT_681559 [Laccaria amethystina LaAM-08-1]|uniref:Transmembrane protein n=1 Tax=Laccaria amethystina LaAM-08-1 TaxID=1095629 RepID=A0A0C9XMZ4_9AGAR|nr:hypothetical protein K443DRAFT_681559 [Laccaria amethystina LaAM-08-1]